jgi:outer membrane lipoprotein-sorting protein
MANRSTTYLSIALLATVFSSGCLFRSHRVPTRTTVTSVKTATLDELVNRINAQAAAIKTLNATVDIDATSGGAKKGEVTEYKEIRGYILLRKPEELRMIGLLPVVRNRAFDMVSNGQGFKLYIPSKNRFVEGPLDVTRPSPNPLENLRPNVIYDALLIKPVHPENEIAVLEHGSDVLTDTQTKNQVAFPTYVVDVIHRGEKGWYLERKVVFSRIDLLPHRQLIYDKNGTLVTEAKYDDYKEFNGILFPTTIEIHRPQEEYTIGLHVLKLTLNDPLRDDQFALAQPPGSQLVRLDSNGIAKEPPGGDAEKR